MATHSPTSHRTWPRLFLEDFERTGTALWFFLYLLTWMNPKTDCVQTTFGRASKEIGVSVLRLKSWLEQLEKEGYLRDESLDGNIIARICL